MKILPFTKTYDRIPALEFPEMELAPGKIYGIIGANGSGKSTLARVLAGVLPADRRGTVLDAASVGYLPQKSHAFRMSTRANLLLGEKDPARAEKLLDGLGIRHLARKRADRLSGGETARMALARLLMKEFQVVILDEPTAAMDMASTTAAEEQIVDYVNSTGCALLLVTHSLRQARRMADEVWFLHGGRLLESGPAAQVLESPTQPETRRFLDFYGA